MRRSRNSQRITLPLLRGKGRRGPACPNTATPYDSDTAMIETDDEMLLTQECVANLRRILLEARKVRSRQDYTRMAEPIPLEIQRREQEILEFSAENWNNL